MRTLLVLDGATYSARKEGSCAPGLNELHLLMSISAVKFCIKELPTGQSTGLSILSFT